MKKPKKSKSKMVKEARKMGPDIYTPIAKSNRRAHISIFIGICAVCLAFWLGTIVGR